MLLNYDFLEFENDKKVRVIDDKRTTFRDKENTYKVELVSALSSDFYEVWAKFSDITLSVPIQNSLVAIVV
ncbi:hypothetical protein JT170_01300 [Helicobacter pylori]|nr:hypothetical protein [Helicobacter pylori]